MKVAFLYGNLKRGGAQRVISVLANRFAAQGDDVTILTLDSGENEYILSPAVKVTGLDLAGDSRNKLESAWRLVKTLIALRRWERTERPDVMVCFSLHLSFQLCLALTACSDRCKIVSSERANPAARDRSAVSRLEDKSLENVDGFIFQTERVSWLFPEVLRKKGAVIHNGLFSEDIPEELTDFDKRRHRDICAVGRLDNDQKAYDMMFRAFAIFHKDHPGHRLNIYGRGRDEEKLRELISQLGLENSIILHGNHPHVINEIKDTGMFVMTSRYEGMPNALIEAMACGLPCVCTDCEFGPAELIEDGVSGLLVTVDDTEEIAAAMARIADDPSFAGRLSEGALDIWRTHSRDEICRQYRDYILSVAARKG